MWSDYMYGLGRDMSNNLSACIGVAGGIVLQELGMDKFLGLTATELLEEVERILCRSGNREMRIQSAARFQVARAEMMEVSWTKYRKRLEDQQDVQGAIKDFTSWELKGLTKYFT